VTLLYFDFTCKGGIERLHYLGEKAALAAQGLEKKAERQVSLSWFDTFGSPHLQLHLAFDSSWP
jgi:hypothetical protein